MKRSSCRLRKASCDDCGYTVRVTRSWLEVGLPACPCGGTIKPTEPADLAFIGLIGLNDMPAREWTAICKAEGWDDSIVRKGAALKAYALKNVALADRIPPKAQCAYPGCGRWVATSHEHCSAHSLEPATSSMPF